MNRCAILTQIEKDVVQGRYLFQLLTIANFYDAGCRQKLFFNSIRCLPLNCPRD